MLMAMTARIGNSITVVEEVWCTAQKVLDNYFEAKISAASLHL